MSTRPPPPSDDGKPASHAPGEEPGTNATESEPDPDAKPIPDGHHKFVSKSPFRAGNT